MEGFDYQLDPSNRSHTAKIESFWQSWVSYYGDSGTVESRGDRLLTAMALRVMK